MACLPKARRLHQLTVGEPYPAVAHGRHGDAGTQVDAVPQVGVRRPPGARQTGSAAR
ncbi:hypothetical protein ACTWPT_39190 [Nonomuraea sp. 3N208]|uniref:hypothetical protein n=1 Tax=Nonomuraea sp. 3N208 TaxID=3457421 RepID=UPI003FCF6A98